MNTQTSYTHKKQQEKYKSLKKNPLNDKRKANLV